MADTITYGMGQLRYVESSSYMNDKSFQTKAVKTMVTSTSESETTESSEFYQDVYLYSNDSNFSFAVGVPYLLHLDIPKDSSYDCIYQLKMIPSSDIGTSNTVDASKLNYQMIKYISVPKVIGIGNTSRIILYPTDSQGSPGMNMDGSYNLNIAIAKSLNDMPEENDIVFDESTNKYYVYNGSTDTDGDPIIGDSTEVLNKNDTIMEHTWATSNIATETVGFDIIFTPRSNNVTYNGIFIQMQRSSLDYDIYSNNIYGRKIDISSSSGWNAKVYQLTNLITGSSGNVPSPLINIGVYSHPNLLMAINGEEIHVGQSGYYELNDFEITSLAIAASYVNDKFTIDYQYKTS